MEQLTKNQAVATSQEAVQNQNEPQLRDENAHNDKSVHGVLNQNLLKFMRASIKMIGVSNLQSFIASMTQKLTLSDISDESKNYLDKAGITSACLRIKSKWTAGGK